MCKKLAIAALLVAAGVVAFKKLDIKCCRKNDSLETRIQRQKQRLTGTDGEIKKFIRQIALREVELEELTREIADVQTNQVKNKKAILVRRAELKTRQGLVAAKDAANAEHKQAVKELGYVIDAYKRCEEHLTAKEKKRDALKEALNAAHDELQAYQAQRDELAVELAQLEAALARVRVEEVKSKIHFDKSELSRIKKETANIRKDISVRQKENELEGRYGLKETRQTTEKTDRNVLQEVDELFGGEAK